MTTQTLQHNDTFNAVSALLLLMVSLLLVTPPSRADEQAPSAVVSDAIDTVMTRLKNETEQLQGEPQALYALVADVVLPHFDIPRISRMALGKTARRANKEILARFADEFRILLIRTYASSLRQYAGEAMAFPTREKRLGKNRASVHLDIQRPGQATIAMEFRMHNQSGPWLVYDIKIEGISLVANYRTEFASIVHNQGLEALIDRLHRKNAGVRIAAR